VGEHVKREKSVAIIIPALNEEQALKRLLAEIPAGSAEWTIVVDNGSTDRTAEVARAAGAIVTTQPIKGYGRACWSGLQTAQDLGAEVLVYMDGDGSDNPDDLPKMLQPVLSEEADLVIGSRISALAERGAVPPQARLGNWLVSRFISLYYHVRLHDIGSFRVISAQKLLDLHMSEMTFGWPVEMLVKAAQARYHVLELPIAYRRRSHGRSKVAGTIVGSMKAAYAMVSVTLHHVIARGVNA
jgi:glycosyltransferase involved in cell wall biosynthesis